MSALEYAGIASLFLVTGICWYEERRMAKAHDRMMRELDRAFAMTKKQNLTK